MAIEAVPCAMLMADRSGAIVLANGQIEKIFGYKKEELLGNTVEVLIESELQDEHKKLVQSYVLDPQTRLMGVGIEVFGKHKNGNLIPIEVGLHPANLEGGLHVMTSVIDISPRRKIEKEIREKKEELDQIKNMDLLGRIVGGISHDINNNLAIIKGHIELLSKSEALKGRSKERVHSILEALDKTATLTKEILAMGRCQELNKKKVNISDIIHDILNSFSHLKQKGITVDFKLPKKDIYIHADPSKIFESIGNLLKNAEEAIEGSGRISISLDESVYVRMSRQMEVENKNFVKITVKDTGIGIKKEQRENVLRPFFTTKEKRRGLGLSVVEGVIGQHGGFLEFESIEKQGTQFIIFLPVISQERINN